MSQFIFQKYEQHWFTVEKKIWLRRVLSGNGRILGVSGLRNFYRVITLFFYVTKSPGILVYLLHMTGWNHSHNLFFIQNEILPKNIYTQSEKLLCEIELFHLHDHLIETG